MARHINLSNLDECTKAVVEPWPVYHIYKTIICGFGRANHRQDTSLSIRFPLFIPNSILANYRFGISKNLYFSNLNPFYANSAHNGYRG
jgi:hypothetical protein